MYPVRVKAYRRRKVKRIIPEPEKANMSLDERWQAMEPFWEMIRNTAYAKQTLITIRDIFGVDDLNRDTYRQLSEAIAKSRGSDWCRHVLKDKANIAVSIVDWQSTELQPGLFVPSMRLDHFISVQSRADLAGLEEEAGVSVHSLDDLVKAMCTALEGYKANGAVAVKTGLAYNRILRYDKVSRYEAETAFNRIASHLGEGLAWLEAKPLQDYIMHQVVRASIEAGLPVQVHTGLQEGNENIITNADPTHLVNLFIEYKEARFDLFHGGYPYVHEWATLAKYFPNVTADITWLPIISPEMARRLLHELIETVPGNKIMAFGGDSMTVEMAYGHSVMARGVVERVLCEKVDEGYLGEDEAIMLARRMLRDNPASLYNLKVE
jgi:predicted TIM-barrel fold metal-dependent hydrolase